MTKTHINQDSGVLVRNLEQRETSIKRIMSIRYPYVCFMVEQKYVSLFYIIGFIDKLHSRTNVNILRKQI